MSKILHTVNITTDAGFNAASGLGSAGITFWTNYDGFRCTNFVVQNTQFPSNNEAELFGILMGIEKLNIMAFKRAFKETVQTVNIYCDNYTALSTITVIHDDIVYEHKTKQDTITHGMDTFFNTLAEFEHINVHVLRAAPGREPVVHHLCERLYAAFDFLVSVNGIVVDFISHVKGHIISSTQTQYRFKSNRKIFKGKRDRVEVVDVEHFIDGEYDNDRLPVPFIGTALSPIELYTNCVADTLASVRLGEIMEFKTALNQDMEEIRCRNSLHALHLQLVRHRTIQPPSTVFNRTIENIEEVSKYHFDQRTISYIEETYLKYYRLEKRRCAYTKL